ncbi:MAG: GNAT family N-acetyltransferase [Ferruginibacter sp.]
METRVPADKVSIVPYTAVHKVAIKELNYEWLEKYFFVEPNDVIQLSDPQGEIIDKGGSIFYAMYKGEPVGTASLMKVSDDEYELAKMAVTEKYKSFGIGRRLMEHCIREALSLKAKKIILYSNTKLVPAIQLYRKYGFVEVPPSAGVHYIRSDIKMEKILQG